MPTLLVALVGARVLPLSHVVSGWCALLKSCDGGVSAAALPATDHAAASAAAAAASPSSSAPANVISGGIGIGCGGRAALLRASVSLLEALVAARHPSEGQALLPTVQLPTVQQPTESSGVGCGEDMDRREVLSRVGKALAEDADARGEHLHTLYVEVERYCQRWREVRPLRRVQLLREAMAAPTSQ